MTTRRASLALFALLLAAALCLPAPAAPAPSPAPSPAVKEDAAYALIFGTVWTADNQPAYGVKVKIRRADQGKGKWEAVSDHRGEFAVRVPAGAADYVLQADVKTKAKGPKPEAKVHVDNDERVDVSLHLTE